MLRLYEYLLSGNCYKARLAMTQLGVPYELVEVNIRQGESRTPAFLAKNPNGRIPLLELDDGRLLPESNAILWYLAEGTPLLPNDRFERAQVLQWMFFEQYNHEPNVATSRWWLHFLKVGEERKEALAQKHEAGMAALGVMERWLEQHPFFVGDRYSIADIALYAYTHVAGEGGFDLARFPATLRWCAGVASQPRHLLITQGQLG